jgi:hypothetical protein
MNSIFLADSCRLKSYSASTKGGNSIVKIEIEITDHYEFGWMLQDLEKIDAAQKAAKIAKMKPPVPEEA